MGIKELCIRHYKVNKEIALLKSESSALCCMRDIKPCVAAAYDYVAASSGESDYGYSITFNEVWDNFEDCLDFKPCNACIEQRRIKKLRIEKQVERGHIRTSITKIGKKLSEVA
jgi:hypothetical protein